MIRYNGDFPSQAYDNWKLDTPPWYDHDDEYADDEDDGIRYCAVCEGEMDIEDWYECPECDDCVFGDNIDNENGNTK